MCVEKKCLYHSFVHPYLTYSIENWGSASKIQLHPLFLTQKKVARIITFSHYLVHTHPLFLSLSIILLDKLFLNQIGIVMYKYYNGLLSDVMNRLYVKNNVIHSYYTRENNLLRIPRCTANFTNISARVWNVLDTNIHFYRIIILIYFFLPCLTLSSSNMCTATIVKPTTLVNQTTYICNLINPLLNLNMIIIILKQPTIYKYG